MGGPGPRNHARTTDAATASGRGALGVLRETGRRRSSLCTSEAHTAQGPWRAPCRHGRGFQRPAAGPSGGPSQGVEPDAAAQEAPVAAGRSGPTPHGPRAQQGRFCAAGNHRRLADGTGFESPICGLLSEPLPLPPSASVPGSAQRGPSHRAARVAPMEPPAQPGPWFQLGRSERPVCAVPPSPPPTASYGGHSSIPTPSPLGAPMSHWTATVPATRGPANTGCYNRVCAPNQGPRQVGGVWQAPRLK